MEEQIESLKDATIEEKREIISELGIYELRGVARALGVPSPTTKKRDFLIDAIIELLKNNNFESVQNGGKGRPFKKLESVDTILNLLGDNNIKEMDGYKDISYDNIMVFAQEVPVFEFQSNEYVKMSGVLRFNKKNAYFIDLNQNKVVFVQNDVLSRYDLQNGDYIECNAYSINDKDQYCVKEILKINSVSLGNYICEIKPLRQRVLPKNLLDLSGKELILGSRNYTIIEDPLFFEKETIEILSQINRLNKKILFLGLDLCAEDNMILDKFNNFLKFVSEYEKDNTILNFNKIVDVINYSERLCRAGESVVLVVYDPVKILSALDEYYKFNGEDKKGKHYQQAMVVFEKLMSLSSAFSDGGEYTSILICNNFDIENDFMKNQVLKISKKIK